MQNSLAQQIIKISINVYTESHRPHMKNPLLLYQIISISSIEFEIFLKTWYFSSKTQNNVILCSLNRIRPIVNRLLFFSWYVKLQEGEDIVRKIALPPLMFLHIFSRHNLFKTVVLTSIDIWIFIDDIALIDSGLHWYDIDMLFDNDMHRLYCFNIK